MCAYLLPAILRTPSLPLCIPVQGRAKRSRAGCAGQLGDSLKAGNTCRGSVLSHVPGVRRTDGFWGLNGITPAGPRSGGGLLGCQRCPCGEWVPGGGSRAGGVEPGSVRLRCKPSTLARCLTPCLLAVWWVCAHVGSAPPSQLALVHPNGQRQWACRSGGPGPRMGRRSEGMGVTAGGPRQ